MGTESQPASYCLVDSPEKKRCLFTVHLSRETDHFRNDCRIYIFRYKSTVHFYTSSLWNICFELLLNHLCISRISIKEFRSLMFLQLEVVIYKKRRPNTWKYRNDINWKFINQTFQFWLMHHQNIMHSSTNFRFSSWTPSVLYVILTT